MTFSSHIRPTTAIFRANQAMQKTIRIDKVAMKNAILALMLLVFVGCGVSNVVIDGNFPTPNVGKLPIRIAVYYDPALLEYSYLEYSETGTEEFNIESGQSHVKLFNAILPAMETVPVIN